MASTIATKADLQLLRQELRADISGLRQEIVLVRKDMEIMSRSLSAEIILKTGSMIVVATGLLFAALKLT